MSLPASLSVRTVTATFLRGDGTPQTGTVWFTRQVLLQGPADHILLTPYRAAKTLDSTGSLSVDLPVTNDPDWAPTGWAYEVAVNVDGFNATYTVTLAPGAPVDLAAILPAGPAPTVPSQYVLQAAVGTPGGPAGPLDVNGHIPASQYTAGGGGGAVASVDGRIGTVTLTDLYVAAAKLGAANGAAALNAAGRVPAAQLGQAPVNLTDAATITTDASLSNQFRVTLGGNRTLGNPTNGFDGQVVMWSVKQDPTGGRTLALDTKFRLGTDITTVVLSTTAGKTDKLGAQYNQADDRWDVVSFVRGY